MDRRLAAYRFEQILEAIPPASGAVVRGTGIVSIGLLLDGEATLSLILLALDAAIWIGLVVLLPARAIRDLERFRADVRTPAALTSIAGTGVLGTRLTLLGWTWAGAALLVFALVIWLGLVPCVLHYWHVPTVGASFILTVATESLGLLAASLALALRSTWLLYASLVPFALGLVFYALVLARFDFRQLTVGSGDQWVTGGALAISTVTAGRIALATEHLGALPGGRGTLQGSGARPVGADHVVVTDSGCGGGDAFAAQLQRQALVNGVPCRHVCGLQLRRRRSHRHPCDHRLRGRLGLGGRCRMECGVRRNDSARSGAGARRFAKLVVAVEVRLSRAVDAREACRGSCERRLYNPVKQPQNGRYPCR